MTGEDDTRHANLEQFYRFRRVFTEEQAEIFLRELAAMIDMSAQGERNNNPQTGLTITCANGHLRECRPLPALFFPAPEKAKRAV